jgi:small membrane protein
MAGVAFRLVLLLGLVGTAYYAFLRKNRLPIHLVLVLGLLGVGGTFVVFPDLSNDVAHLLGLWRGADLVTYLLEILLLFVVLHHAVRFSEMEANMTILVRRLALLEAEIREARTAGEGANPMRST